MNGEDGGTARDRAQAVPALQLDGVSVRFGGVSAVSFLSCTVGERELVGVIGPNGAGKTTLFDAVCGLVGYRGCVRVSGQRIDGLSPQARSRAGIGRTFQDARLFPALTVRETLTLALQRPRDDPGVLLELAGVHGTARLRTRVAEVIDLFGLGGYADSLISDLSTGTRRVVDIARSYAQQPSLILLDEPASGIAQREVEALGDVILRLRQLAGVTILLVEHDVPLVRHVADRVMVMESGRLIADGDPATVLELPAVIASYLGSDASAVRRSGVAASQVIVEIADAETAMPDDAPPIGLPPRDDFRVPVRRLGAGLVTAAASLLVAALAFGSGAAPAPVVPSAAATNPRIPAAATSPSPPPSVNPTLPPPGDIVPLIVPAVAVPPSGTTPTSTTPAPCASVTPAPTAAATPAATPSAASTPAAAGCPPAATPSPTPAPRLPLPSLPLPTLSPLPSPPLSGAAPAARR